MVVDNFELIKPLFYFNEANNMFFHLQILRRGKDHPELPAANKLIRSWLVRSREQLDSLKDEIVFLCEHYKARAYINVAGKDFDKLNARNPIPWTIRKEMVEEAIGDTFLVQGHKEKIKVVELPDLSDESDNSHDWGFYLYSFIVSQTHEPNFTIYYSDGFEIITSWFPGFLLRNNVSLSLLARNTCENGISATEVRELILNGRLPETGVVPESVYKRRETIKAFLNVFNK